MTFLVMLIQIILEFLPVMVFLKFLKNVGIAYGEMMKENSKIDPTLKSNYLSTTKDKYVYQRVGIDGMANNSNFNPGTPPSPYGDNATDYIWQMSSGGEDQIGEVIEHLLHTATAVIPYLSHSQWDYNTSLFRITHSNARGNR